MESRRYAKWTKKEDNYLIENYADTDNNDLADALERTRHAINRRASNVLGLKKEYTKTMVNLSYIKKGLI